MMETVPKDTFGRAVPALRDLRAIAAKQISTIALLAPA